MNYGLYLYIGAILRKLENFIMSLFSILGIRILEVYVKPTQQVSIENPASNVNAIYHLIQNANLWNSIANFKWQTLKPESASNFERKSFWT